MKKITYYLALALSAGILFAGCGGGDSGSSGTVTMNVTDAKPVLSIPPGSEVESVTITFDEVSVHKSGGGWVTLPAVQQPFSIDLYQFLNGNKTQFVPPVKIDSGKYTQVRIGVTDATIQIKNDKGEIETLDLEIPSENLKTDKNFEFEVPDGGAVDLTVDFDLSQSIVVTGTGTYQLKPVLHINETSNAATIEGTINWAPSTQVTVTVTLDKFPYYAEPDNTIIGVEDETYTQILVSESEQQIGEPSFRIFWLVPEQGYFVRVVWGDPQNGVYYEEYVDKSNLPAKPGGAVYELNGGNTISPTI